MAGNRDESRSLPRIVVTGASGFIGRHFLRAARDRYHIFALARRSQRDAGLSPHPNIRWLMADIADRDRLEARFSEIAREGGAEFLLHLAGFYRFDRLHDPEYERTNVTGTRNVLDSAARLELRRLVFASSVTVTEFRKRSGVIDERSSADADFPYARSKARGEAMVREMAGDTPGAVVRLAAVFSDWGEYGPLYMLLSNWFSGGWCSRVLPGRGMSAIPYIHVSYVVELFLEIFERSDRLKPFDVYVAGPHRSVSQKELFDLATSYYFGRARKPLLVPAPLTFIGLACRNFARGVVGAPPRERLWMMRYVDHLLAVDPSYTLAEIPVRQRRRLQLPRRIAFIIENAKNYPIEWRARNEAAIRKTGDRPEMIVCEVMRSRNDEIVDRVTAAISEDPRLASYQTMERDRLRWYVQLVFQLLTHAAATGDRTPLIDYATYIAHVRKLEGFPAGEVKQALRTTGRVVVTAVLEDPALSRYGGSIRDTIQLSIEPACDEIDDTYETSQEPPVFREKAIDDYARRR